MTQEIYYKATKANGTSGYDKDFTYRLGLNVHPRPNKKDTSACGVGIHLAKTIKIAKGYVSGWKEIYEARAGIILGEDEKKIRTTHCFLTRCIATSDITYPKKPSLCDEWVNEHAYDITMAQIKAQTLEVVSPNHRTCITLGMKKTDRKFLVKSTIQGGKSVAHST